MDFYLAIYWNAMLLKDVSPHVEGAFRPITHAVEYFEQ